MRIPFRFLLMNILCSRRDFEETKAKVLTMGKRNLTWTEEMDDLLVDSLMDQMRKGQKKVGGVFSKRALATVADLISEQFDLFCHSEHIKNRMKTLKTNFSVAKGILSSRGFSLNHSSQVIEARANVWETYIKVRLVFLYLLFFTHDRSFSDKCFSFFNNKCERCRRIPKRPSYDISV